MSNAVSALGGAVCSDGIATITEFGPQGMITLRGDLSSGDVKEALTAAGFPPAEQREIAVEGDLSTCWMSPDEVLLLCAYADVSKAIETLQSNLGHTHALAVNVSDARAIFRVSGRHTRDVIAKLAPVDLGPHAFPVGSFRRTRLAQVAAAFHMRDEDTCEIICFRSVGQYMFDLLKKVSEPGSEVGYF
ncbi:MAG: sarcosine oxidase subunit gamma family protein [Aliishimia sp.]